MNFIINILIRLFKIGTKNDLSQLKHNLMNIFIKNDSYFIEK